MKTIPQGSLIWPKEAFQFKASGRPITAYPNQSFWVCNSSVNQQMTGIVQIARSGRNAGTAWHFTLGDANNLFTYPKL